ncbi:hypothetical protein Cylst_1940 [Cylindrospermum stagnale PCC 7417]|uniref:CHAT domain-containing protein n=1 Tax=Cylindrospermum stagnale PCC 7417 TaxID=56107 RepID=K9WVG1_9NOST|nr:CHAT domain-containing tetratricopeptide repeat protein [Cylindrospermum stagnale]AFZ24188.1 hypothetical protein Cylst_1940 [Cylindrospermum stagnale PCC 7417]
MISLNMSTLKNQKLKSYIVSVTFCLVTVALTLPSLLAAPIPNQTLPALQYRAELLLNLGSRQLTNGQFSAALASLRESLQIYQEIGDRAGEANTLFKIGETHFTLGQYQQAISLYRQSLYMVRELDDRTSEAKILDRLGNGYLNIGEEKLAKEFREQAAVLRKEIGNPVGEAAFLGNAGLNLEVEGEDEKAIAFYQQQLAIAQKNRDLLLQVDAFKNLAVVSRKLGQYPQAISFYQQELSLARKLGDNSREGIILQELAATYAVQGDANQAVAFYQQQLALASKSPDKVNQTYLIKQLGRAYSASAQHEKAIALYQQQLTTAKAAKDTFAEGTALNNLAFALFKSGKTADAETTLNENIKVWQNLRSNLGITDNYAAEQANTYQLLQQVLISQKQPESALEIAEQGRTMAFLNLLGMRLASESAGTGLKVAPKQIAPPTIKQIQEIAKQQKATLIKYAIIPDDGVYVWVIQPTGKVTFRQINPKLENTISPINSLTDVIASIPTFLGAKTQGIQPQKDAKPLLQLNQLLIKPIADLLPENPKERIIFILQDELLLIPFPALVDIYGKYLIEKHTISTVPAIQILNLTKEKRNKTGGSKVIVVGNPIMPKISQAIGATPQPLPPLVNSEKEALVIADFFKTTALIGNQATKTAILPLLPKAKTIHLATYGLLDDVNRKGIPGAIALSSAGEDDGILTSSDILNLYTQPKGKRLRAGLVVLSAGETGNGKSTGAGVLGLSLALISAGIPSIIISQWTVPDAPTDLFMTEFYRQLKQNPDKAQALRNAMLATMKQNPNPKYWAGFNLIGEAR